MSTKNRIPMKVRTTFGAAGTLLLPAPSGSWHLTSQVRDAAGTWYGNTTVTLGSPTLVPGSNPAVYSYPITLMDTAGVSAGWPIGALESDVRAEDDTSPAPVVIQTGTFFIDVMQRVTSP